MEQTRILFWGILISAALAVLVGLLLQLLLGRERVDRESAETTRTALNLTAESVTQTAAILPTIPAAATESPPTLAPDPTRVVAQALLEQARNWQLIAFEPFDNNHTSWDEGEGGEMSRGVRTVEGGKYVWNLEALENFTRHATAMDVSAESFYLAVDLEKQTKGVGTINVVYRFRDNSNYYDFGICEDGQSYQLWRQYQDDWEELIPCTYTETLHTDQPNTLTIIAQESEYNFYFNDQHVATWLDAFLRGGRAGVSVDLDTGQSNLFQFDNFEVRFP